MKHVDNEFAMDRIGLMHAVDLLGQAHCDADLATLPTGLPVTGLGSHAVLDLLAPLVLGGAARLGAAAALAHMDPPTPWLTWATALWNASLNQNLLHPATAPVARVIEERVVDWFAPLFGMDGGHMTPGSTLANLTALWAARECAGVERVAASDCAHLSIAKAAHLLGLGYQALPTGAAGALLAAGLPLDLSKTALVLTAGTTSTGVIDPLGLCGRAAWTHVDAAWAGPLRLSEQYAARLAGVEAADSVAVSAHKWLFQPKESALVLFRDAARAHAAVSFGGAYLAVPNVGVLGSHGAAAVPLLATALAWGRSGIAARIEHCMTLSETLAEFVDGEPALALLATPQTGVVIWRPHDEAVFDPLAQQLPAGLVSTTTVATTRWFRNVAANPNADVRLVISHIRRALAHTRV